MPEKVVLDTSVLIKLFVKENGAEKVDDILRLSVRGEMRIFCPEFLLMEILNVLLVAKKLKTEKAMGILERLQRMKVVFEEFGDGYGELAELSTKFGLTVYDSLYLDLAMKWECQLVTADKQLLKIKKYCVSLEDFKMVI